MQVLVRFPLSPRNDTNLGTQVKWCKISSIHRIIIEVSNGWKGDYSEHHKGIHAGLSTLHETSLKWLKTGLKGHQSRGSRLRHRQQSLESAEVG